MSPRAYSAWQTTTMSEHGGDFPMENAIAKTVHPKRITSAQRSPDRYQLHGLDRQRTSIKAAADKPSLISAYTTNLSSQTVPDSVSAYLLRLFTARTHNPAGGNHLLTAEGEGVAEIFRRLGTQKVIQVGEVATI